MGFAATGVFGPAPGERGRGWQLVFHSSGSQGEAETWSIKAVGQKHAWAAIGGAATEPFFCGNWPFAPSSRGAQAGRTAGFSQQLGLGRGWHVVPQATFIHSFLVHQARGAKARLCNAWRRGDHCLFLQQYFSHDPPLLR